MRRAIAFLFWAMFMIAALAPHAAAQREQLVVGFSAYSAAFMPAFVADRHRVSTKFCEPEDHSDIQASRWRKIRQAL